MTELWKKYSGSWTLQQQMQAIAAGTWTGIPQPELYSWGINAYGQLGQNDLVNRSSPVQVGALKNWAQVTAGGSTSTLCVVAVKDDNTLWSWGRNNNGQLGQNIATTINRSSPVQVGALTNWLKVSAFYSCLAIKTDGTLWAWGLNSNGQLGQNDTVSRSSPVQVGSLTNWSQVTVNGGACLSIKTDGTLWAWGGNFSGELGLNNTTFLSSPVQVGALTDWSSIGGGLSGSIAIKTDGTLWSWGYNGNGELGLNDLVSRSSPVQVGALTNWAQAAKSSIQRLAIKANGTLWAWARNNSGTLGLGDTNNRSSPTQVGALTNWLQVSGGTTHCLALKTDGTLWSWGQNNNRGQLGQNNAINTSSPVQVGGGTNWSQVSAAGNSSFAINAPPT